MADSENTDYKERHHKDDGDGRKNNEAAIRELIDDFAKGFRAGSKAVTFGTSLYKVAGVE